MTTTAARMPLLSMYAQCSHCQTIYRVSTEQLSAARGRVRCGVCEHIFNALDSLSEQIPAPRPSAHSTEMPAESAAMAASSPTLLHNEVSSAPSRSDSAPDQEPATTPPTASAHAETPVTSPPSTTTSFRITDQVAEDITPLVINARRHDDAVFAIPQPKVGVSQPSAGVSQPKVGESQFRPTPSDQEQKTTSTEPYITAEARPLEARVKTAGGQWYPTALWSLLNLLLIVTLLGQYAYFNRAELAQHGELRPVLAQFCALLECELPLQRDVNRIAIANRSVHSHPQHPNALLINTTLINEAPHAQPYPLLELVFSNLNGAAVAGRQFRPEEYLPSGTDIAAGMTPRRPVTVAVEILDPGKEAVNFQFELR